jgi:hypothetical protein
MNAKKKNPKLAGNSQRKSSKSDALLRSESTGKGNLQTPSLTATVAFELERQKKLECQMQAAGTAPSDDVVKATEALYSSARSLLGLIEKQYLPDPKVDINTTEAEERFCSFAAWIVQELCSLSKHGHYVPLRAAWHGGRLIGETIHDVALDGPSEQLQRIARAALYMPSLRVNTKIFKHDFDETAKKLQLSKDHTIRVDPQAEYQLDRPATRFVVKMIERFTFLRQTLAEKKEELLQFQNDPQAKPGLKGTLMLTTFKLIPATLDNWLAWDFPERMVSELLLCENIKPLSKDTADEWLEKFLTPLVGSYQHLQELIGIPYFQELEPVASKSSKPYGIRDELIKRCRQVLQGKTFFPENVAPSEGISSGT